MEKVRYNLWVIIEKVTETDNDELYEDLDELPVKCGTADTLEEALELAKSFEIIW